MWPPPVEGQRQRPEPLVSEVHDHVAIAAVVEIVPSAPKIRLGIEDVPAQRAAVSSEFTESVGKALPLREVSTRHASVWLTYRRSAASARGRPKADRRGCPQQRLVVQVAKSLRA